MRLASRNIKEGEAEINRYIYNSKKSKEMKKTKRTETWRKELGGVIHKSM